MLISAISANLLTSHRMAHLSILGSGTLILIKWSEDIIQQRRKNVISTLHYNYHLLHTHISFFVVLAYIKDDKIQELLKACLKNGSSIEMQTAVLSQAPLFGQYKIQGNVSKIILLLVSAFFELVIKVAGFCQCRPVNCSRPNRAQGTFFFSLG